VNSACEQFGIVSVTGSNFMVMLPYQLLGLGRFQIAGQQMACIAADANLRDMPSTTPTLPPRFLHQLERRQTPGLRLLKQCY
jgi:hypothetical protein